MLNISQTHFFPKLTRSEWNTPNRRGKSQPKKIEYFYTPIQNRFTGLGDGIEQEITPDENSNVGIFKYKSIKRKLFISPPKNREQISESNGKNASPSMGLICKSESINPNKSFYNTTKPKQYSNEQNYNNILKVK